jgi:hypothetical protein
VAEQEHSHEDTFKKDAAPKDVAAIGPDHRQNKAFA